MLVPWRVSYMNFYVLNYVDTVIYVMCICIYLHIPWITTYIIHVTETIYVWKNRCNQPFQVSKYVSQILSNISPPSTQSPPPKKNIAGVAKKSVKKMSGLVSINENDLWHILGK